MIAKFSFPVSSHLMRNGRNAGQKFNPKRVISQTDIYFQFLIPLLNSSFIVRLQIRRTPW
ncbi:hypothetical protein SLEP1_g51459 [Rubroshorea leprosula]|uniref:Uncharacterized protein n=1 Tax=Rubroshorea leprosula TaxID=152421 RepID=A0AAV5M6X1_9ROSI|nr:hypothetical protein SLEP1_g51459 [Rubroshorea leprosula]